MRHLPQTLASAALGLTTSAVTIQNLRPGSVMADMTADFPGTQTSAQVGGGRAGGGGGHPLHMHMH